MTEDATGLAEALLAARRGGSAVTGPEPASLDEAYAVQRAVAAALGPARAFKTGRKADDGVPIMAPILDLRPSPARYGAAELVLIGVELEIGFLIEAPLPPVDLPDFAERAADCIAAVPVIEICDSRLADPEGAAPLLRLADNQLNGGLVVGTPVADWRDLDLRRVSAWLKVGDETLLDGEAAAPGGDPYASFCELARLIGTHCGGLAPGQVVITGSLHGLPWIGRGRRVEGEIRGLGRVEVDFPD